MGLFQIIWGEKAGIEPAFDEAIYPSLVGAAYPIAHLSHYYLIIFIRLMGI